MVSQLQVPKGQWLCPICTVMLHKGQTLFSHQTEVEKAKLSQMQQPEVGRRVALNATLSSVCLVCLLVTGEPPTLPPCSTSRIGVNLPGDWRGYCGTGISKTLLRCGPVFGAWINHAASPDVSM